MGNVLYQLGKFSKIWEELTNMDFESEGGANKKYVWFC